MAGIRGKDQVSGNWGQFWIDGELYVEVNSFEAKINPNREDVPIDMDIDSKLISLAGEGTYSLKKMFTRGKAKVLEKWKKGEDPRFNFVAKIADPDTRGKQEEKISIGNVWLNELTLLTFEKGSLVNEEFSFGFTPSDSSFMDEISV